jgi:hypothetical protein
MVSFNISDHEQKPNYNAETMFIKASNSVTLRHIVQVYLPCILQTKKRYVGYMYETRDQLKPEYDAKGIETVRYSHKKLQVNAINTTNIYSVKFLKLG